VLHLARAWLLLAFYISSPHHHHDYLYVYTMAARLATSAPIDRAFLFFISSHQRPLRPAFFLSFCSLRAFFFFFFLPSAACAWQRAGYVTNPLPPLHHCAEVFFFPFILFRVGNYPI